VLFSDLVGFTADVTSGSAAFTGDKISDCCRVCGEGAAGAAGAAGRADFVVDSRDALPFVVTDCAKVPDSLCFSGSENFTGGVRFSCGGLGVRGATGGRTDGVARPVLVIPFADAGRGGECFVGEMPVAVDGRAEA
jgi:hypothetical protein